MKILINIFYFYILLTLIDIILTKKNKSLKPKCCKGSENFGIGLYSRGVSCSDMINCCPSGYLCSSGKCIPINKNKRGKRRKISKYKNNEDKKDNNENIDKEPEFMKGDEIIKPVKIEKKPTFTGPVKINWETFTKCLTDSGSKEQYVKDIIREYKKKKESSAMKIVFSELKKNTPLIIDCLNNQEHLVK
jgi:hypothetical protein